MHILKKNYKVKEEKEQKILNNKIIDSKRQGNKEKDETKKQLLNCEDNMLHSTFSGSAPALGDRGWPAGYGGSSDCFCCGRLSVGEIMIGQVMSLALPPASRGFLQPHSLCASHPRL